MLSLALIPAATLIALIVLVATTKYRYLVGQQKVHTAIEKERLAIQTGDDANDADLVVAAATNRDSLRALIQQYNDARTKLLPAVGRDWDEPACKRHLQAKALDRTQVISRKLFYRTCIYAVLIVAGAGVAALARYHHLSAASDPPPPASFTMPTDDPFAVSAPQS